MATSRVLRRAPPGRIRHEQAIHHVVQDGAHLAAVAGQLSDRALQARGHAIKRFSQIADFIG